MVHRMSQLITVVAIFALCTSIPALWKVIIDFPFSVADGPVATSAHALTAVLLLTALFARNAWFTIPALFIYFWW